MDEDGVVCVDMSFFVLFCFSVAPARHVGVDRGLCTRTRRAKREREEGRAGGWSFIVEGGFCPPPLPPTLAMTAYLFH
jgi:hypothetical protein